MISSENLSFLLGVVVFYGETIIPKGTRDSQLSFKFTIRKMKFGGEVWNKMSIHSNQKRHNKQAVNKAAKRKFRKRLRSRRWRSNLILENVISFTKQCRIFGFRDEYRMFCNLIFKITVWRISLKLGEYVPDSGQEHTANGKNSFSVPAVNLMPAVSFFKFGVCLNGS